MVNWDAIVVAKWRRRSSFFDFLKFCPGYPLVRFIVYCFTWMSPTFFCFLVVVAIASCYFRANLSGLENLVSHIFVILINNIYAIYPLMYSNSVPRPQRITLNSSTVSTVIAANLPCIVGKVDPELRRSFFNARGLVSLVICFLTELDLLLFYLPLLRPGRLVIVDSYPQLYRQTCLHFLVFVSVIVFGGANMIVKALHGDLEFLKHVLFLLILCVFSYIRFREKYYRLRRIVKKSRVVVPIDE